MKYILRVNLKRGGGGGGKNRQGVLRYRELIRLREDDKLELNAAIRGMMVPYHASNTLSSNVSMGGVARMVQARPK